MAAISKTKTVKTHQDELDLPPAEPIAIAP